MQPITRPVTLYTPMPCGVLLPAKAIALYTALSLMAHSSGECVATLEQLGRAIGQRPGGRITAYLRALQEARLIEYSRGRRMTRVRVK